MATRVSLPVITRKKTVSSRYNPNTFRVICHDVDNYKTKYQGLSRELRAQDPLGNCVNKRPDILSYFTKVLPTPLYDYRANRPCQKNCDFLRENYHTLNEPICYTQTEGQPQGHWMAPILHQEEFPQPQYTRDTTFREDFPGFDHHAMPKKTKEDKEKSKKPKFPWNKHIEDLKEKISFEHCYDCRTENGYPIRGKRLGAIIFKNNMKESL